MTAHGMEYWALFGQVGSARPAVRLPGFLSWIPVKINTVLAEPRTSAFFQYEKYCVQLRVLG